MKLHLMIDFETLGQKQDCVVLSLGACLFTCDGILNTFYSAFNLDQPGRTKQDDTMAWWAKQDEAARGIFKECENGSDLSLLPGEFNKFVGNNTVKIWSCGADFDIPILNHIYESFGAMRPWKFYNHRCYRTIKSMFHIEAASPFQGVKHNALADAKHQATCLAKFLKANPLTDK